MRRTLSAALLGLVLTTSALGSATAAHAAASPKSNPLKCFDGRTEAASAGAPYGTYGHGTCSQKGSTFTLTNPQPSDYSGVYVENQSLAGTAVKDLVIGFTYSGTTGGGAPRISVPLAGGGYLYVDTACDANHDGIVATTESGCIVSDSNGYYGPLSSAPGTVGTGYAFVVADQPGTYVISDVLLGRTPPGKSKAV